MNGAQPFCLVVVVEKDFQNYIYKENIIDKSQFRYRPATAPLVGSWDLYSLLCIILDNEEDAVIYIEGVGGVSILDDY